MNNKMSLSRLLELEALLQQPQTHFAHKTKAIMGIVALIHHASSPSSPGTPTIDSTPPTAESDPQLQVAVFTTGLHILLRRFRDRRWFPSPTSPHHTFIHAAVV